MPTQALSITDVALAASVILINGLLSVLLRLRLERQLLWASGRSIAQLSLLGLILKWVFEQRGWYVVVLMLLMMTTIAGIASVQRTKRRYSGIWMDAILSVWVSSWMMTAFALFVVMRAEPWYLPRYSIPFLGMILGNCLTGISLGLDRFGSELSNHRDRVEALLALGATRWEAAQEPMREAIRTGMIPILNSMAVTGIVSLPGMMTGQLLAGVDPSQAVRYQIVIIFLIASGIALGTVGVVLLGHRRLFNTDHQFLHSRLRSK